MASVQLEYTLGGMCFVYMITHFCIKYYIAYNTNREQTVWERISDLRYRMVQSLQAQYIYKYIKYCMRYSTV